MNKEKLLTILVFILVILNIGTLAYVTIRQKPHHNEKRMGKQLHDKNNAKFQKLLGFDEAQMKAFRKSKETHKGKVHELNRILSQSSKEFYHKIEQYNSQNQDVLINKIDSINHLIYAANSDHFQELRIICTEDQLPQLHKFIDHLLVNKGRQNPSRRDGKRGPPPRGK